jgi:hypothetical protein
MDVDIDPPWEDESAVCVDGTVLLTYRLRDARHYSFLDA